MKVQSIMIIRSQPQCHLAIKLLLMAVRLFISENSKFVIQNDNVYLEFLAYLSNHQLTFVLR